MRDIGNNVNKLINEMNMAQSPEAMVYLKLLGNELGYLTTTDMQGAAKSAVVMIDSLLKMFQTDVIIIPETVIQNICTEMTYLTPF